MNSWIVTGFFENSNAQKSGLQIDDKIISVNGKDIHNISYKEQEELWDKIDNLVLIVIRNNKEEKIEFKL
jgi:C-terminal processing protease CtpA/Prc